MDFKDKTDTPASCSKNREYDLDNQMNQYRRALSRIKNESEDDMVYRNISYTPLPRQLENMHHTQEELSDLVEQMNQTGNVFRPSVKELRARKFDDRLNKSTRIEFQTGTSFDGMSGHVFTFDGETVYAEHLPQLSLEKQPVSKMLSLSRTEFLHELRQLDLMDWRKRFRHLHSKAAAETATDVLAWSLTISFPGTRTYQIGGCNTYPWNYQDFLRLIERSHLDEAREDERLSLESRVQETAGPRQN